MPVIPVGLAAVAASAREAGHDVVAVDLLNVEDVETTLRQNLLAVQPNVIGISIRNIDDQKMDSPNFLLEKVKPIISVCRRFSEAPIVLGGAGYSIFPQSVLSYLGADMGIQGEAEIAFPTLLTSMEQKGDASQTPGLFLPAKGLQQKRTFVRELDRLPLPDTAVWAETAKQSPDIWMPVQTRRGCPMNCSYCSTPGIEGRLIRRNSVDRVIDLIRRYREKGFHRFFFTDNTFNIPLSYGKALSYALAEHLSDISWRCILYPDYVDEELVREMARAGCKEVSLGFESGSGMILRNLNKRFDVETIRQTSELLRDYGITRMGFLLLGGPGETKASVEESISFVDALDLEALKITAGIRIYPGTALAKRAVLEGIVSPEDDLLHPKFYLAPQIDSWLRETVKVQIKGRSNWKM